MKSVEIERRAGQTLWNLHDVAQYLKASVSWVYKAAERGELPWFLRVKDAAGRWQDIASTAATKTEAKRLAADLERKAERQRFGLEPFPTDCKLTVGELVE